MKVLIIIFGIFIGILIIGYSILPFILASVFEVSLINWFGIITIPSGLVSIVAVIIYYKIHRKIKSGSL